MQPADARLILREEELDATLELFFLAASALWSTADAALEGDPTGLGRGHYRIAFLLKRRPGAGVQELTRLTGLSKQGASRILADLEKQGLVRKAAGEADMRRRPAVLTAAGAAFEARVSERMRAQLSGAYRAGGLDAVGGARRILEAVAGPRIGPKIGRADTGE